jgi:TP53 regulating kinase-like protein
MKKQKKLNILQQGAEAIIYLDKEKNKIIKKRIKKSYRIPILDEKIRKLRTRSEAKLLKKASKIISIPNNIKENEKTKEIEMEFINGNKLSETLNNFSLQNQKQILQKIGKTIKKLHNADLIHGDLTTSNMILKGEKIRHDPKSKEGLIRGNFGSLYLIDFGLGFHSSKLEDKAVDIHVLKQALEAKHFQHWETLFKEFKKTYNNKQVLERLKAVEKRGRYKH